MDKQKFLEDLFQAYYDARKNKRNTCSQIQYEMDYESNLIALGERLLSKSYVPKKSICFISFYPVQREVFAASFEDRIVHHLLFNYINRFFERLFIHDSYSCRKGKGTLYGVKRVQKFMRSATDNYQHQAYVLKLDISGYFININKKILFEQVSTVLVRFQSDLQRPLDWLLWLTHTIIFHDSIQDVTRKGRQSDWQGLPRNKSLFYAKKDCGLPIGNLTSQLFGNVYLHVLDAFVKYQCHCKYYGRYVDDFFIISREKEKLKRLIPQIASFLEQTLKLELHPKKIYLQPVSHGVSFLGGFVKPYRIYVSKRVKQNFYRSIKKSPNFKDFMASTQSYLGHMQYYHSYRLRKKILFTQVPDKYKPMYMVAGDLSRLFITKKGKQL